MSRVHLGLGLAVVALVGLAAPAHAEGHVRGAGEPGTVDGSYIVVLADGARAEDVAARHGATVRHRYGAALRGFAATMTERQARRAAADPAVAYVEADRVVRTTGDQVDPPSWGLDRLDQRTLPLDRRYHHATTGSGATAYVIDTGIHIGHPDFGGRAVNGRDTVDGDNTAQDCDGHGTHVAGTIGGTAHGVAKGVRLVAVRVINCSGWGTAANVIAGVDWVTANAVKPAVANMSLGGGASTAIDDAVRRSIASGVAYAIASGNENTDACASSPARVLEALTVNASDAFDGRAGFSNHGPCTDIFAPGENIVSTWNVGEHTNTLSGTSMATPHVAGALALHLAANPAHTPSQANAAVLAAATPNLVGDARTTPNLLLHTGSAPVVPPGAGCPAATNGTDVPIPDRGAATSPIPITGCTSTPTDAAKITIDIVHTWRGDLVLDLISPDGSPYRLKSANVDDSADNVKTTYTLNLAAESPNGTWTLRAQDLYGGDWGHINAWTLDL